MMPAIGLDEKISGVLSALLCYREPDDEDVRITIDAILELIEEEREACAKVAEDLRETFKAEAIARASVVDEIGDVIEDYSAATGTAELIARQIRARSDVKP